MLIISLVLHSILIRGVLKMKNKVDPVWIILELSTLCVFNPNGGPLKKTAKTKASFLKKKLHDKNPSQLKDRRCRG